MTQIIAEIGVNWFGDIETAKEMILSSSVAGANSVKFQIFNESVIKKTETDEETKSKLNSMILTPSDVSTLLYYSHKHNVRFGASVMYPEAFTWLKDIPIDFLKVRYADRKNHKIKERADEYSINNHIPLLVSSLMNVYGSYDDIYTGVHRLYCIPKYPPKLSEINSDLIRPQHFSGYSNHYPSPCIPILAVSRELDFVEVHVKQKRTKPIDSAVSITFEELRDICRFKNTLLGMYPNPKKIKDTQKRG